MEDLKLKLDSPEFREQMKLNMPLVVLPNLDHLDLANRIYLRPDDPAFKKRIADAREQLHAQIKQAGADSAQIQKAVDQFVKEVDAATQDLVRDRVRDRTHATPPPPPAAPKPPQPPTP